ncbi:MAG: FtsQ-type POTRA domain-containing protein [Proteobacteria bacterium]|jgi:hypothetical protein|nr:FtsQ-type POTRA domain-containing protein [Pseudomonadota bacterium]
MARNKRRSQIKKTVDKTTFISLARVLVIIILSCSAAIAIPYGAWRLYRHYADMGTFKPQNITITGNVRASDAEILEAADIEREDFNLVEFNVTEVREAIEALEWVKHAHISIDYPDTIHIEIEEHDPLGIVSEKQLIVVDTEGKPIKMWASTDDLMPPIVSASRKKITEHPDIIKEAFGIARLAHTMGYPHQIEEIHYDDATGYALFTDTTEIRIGYDRFDERLSRLLDVDHLLDEKSASAAYILLDAENDLDKVIIKPKFIFPEQALEVPDEASASPAAIQETAEAQDSKAM